MDLYRRAFDAFPDALVVVDGEGRVVRANAQVHSMFGYASDELLGRSIDELVPRRVRVRHRDHRQKYSRDPKTRPMGANLDLYARRKDGTEFPVDICLSPLDEDAAGLILCVVRDMSERRLAEQRFRSLLESAPDAMVIADRAGKIVLVNSQAERVFGYERLELLGQTVEILVPHRYRARHVDHRADYFQASEFRPMGAGLELFGQRRDGSEFPVEISLSPLETSEGRWVCSAIRDISDRKLTEQMIDDLREKEILLKEVHHRVKNNLAVISSMFYLQSTYVEDKDTARILRENQERVRCMAQVHESLYLSDNFASIDISDFSSRLCQNLVFSYAAGREGVTVDTDIRPVHLALELAIPCGLILNELVTNALVHAFPDRTSGEVHVSFDNDGERCRLTVRDTGAGLPVGGLPQPGKTLGMTLVTSLAEQLDGNFEFVKCESGTEARLSFPLPKE